MIVVTKNSVAIKKRGTAKILVFLFFILVSCFSYGQTTYFLTTAGATAPQTPGNWNTGGTGGGGTPASAFTGLTDVFVISSGVTANFPANVTATIAGTLQVDGLIILGTNGNNTNTTLTANGTVLFNSTVNQVTFGTSGGSGNNAFVLGSGATLKTKNTTGILGTNCSIVLNGGRTAATLPATADYEFNGALQSSTTGLPSTVNNLTFSGSNTKTISVAVTVSGKVTISSGATFAASTFTHNVAGDWQNDGTFTANTSTINFNGNNALQTISGTSATTFNLLQVAKTSQSNILEATSTIGLAASGLTLTSGTFKLSGTGTITNTFFNAAGYTIGATAGFWLNNANATVTGQAGSPVLGGLLRVTAGTYNIGTSTGNTLTYNSGSALTIEGGVLNIAGRFCPATAGTSTITYNQSGGTFTVVTQGSVSTTLAGFDIGASGSSFTMSNGIIAIQRVTSNTTNDFLNVASTTSVTGGTIQIGNASTTGSPVIRVRSTAPVYNFVINAAGTPTAQLVTSALTVVNDITIASGTILNANSIGIIVGHDWTNNGGTFTPGTQTVTFNAVSANQTITKSGGETFSSVTINKTSGSVIMANTVTIPGLLTLTGGSLSINGNTLNLSGNASTTSGNITGSSTSNLSITGTGALGTIAFNQSSPGTTNLLSAFTINRTASGTVTLGNSVVNGTSITFTAGSLVLNGNTLTLNGTATTTSGNITGSSTSSLIIGGTGALGTLAFDQTTNPVTNGVANLTVNRTSSGTVTLGSTFNVLTAATFTAGVVDVNGQTFRLGGTVSTTSGTITCATGIVTFNGTSAQSIPASSLFTSNSVASITIANAAGVTFNGIATLSVSGSFSVNASSIFTPASTIIIGGAGTLLGASSSTSVARVTRATGTADFAGQYTITNKTLTNLLVEFAGASAQGVAATTFTALKISNSSGVTMGGLVTTTALNLNTGNFSIGSNTLTINGAVSRTSGNLAGGNTSSLIIGGTAGSLFFDATGTNNYLKAFTINTSSSATLGNALNITAYDGTSSEGVLSVSGTGVLTTGGFLAIKSDANGTARIAAGNTAGGYISGDVSVERFIPQNSSKGWRLLASNTSGQNINAAWQEGQANSLSNPNPGFGTKIAAGNTITTNLTTARAAGFDTLSAGVSLFKYNATTDVLQTVTATNTGNIASEKGYFLFIRGDKSIGQFGAGAPTTSTVLRSKGSLFLGDQAQEFTGTSKYALIRNPYPSRIDMRNIVRGANLIDAYQVWDAKLGGAYGVGGFQTFSKSGANYVVTPGGGSYGANGSQQNFIESGAAFYIQSTTNTLNFAQVTEACKTSASSNSSYRPSGVLAEDKSVAFNLYAINPLSTDVIDGGLVFFNDTYSNSVTVEDVRKSSNFSENFGTLRDNIELVVEKRKDVSAADSIFFKMYQLRQISYRLDFETINFDPAATTAILQDKFTGTNTTLNLSALTSYTFTVSAVAGSFAQDRFRLILSSGNTFSGTGNWTDNARWSRGVPAVPGEAVTIAAGANGTLNTDFTVAGSLTMTATSTLVVNPTKTLTISGTANLAGQSVTFKSDNTGYGSLGQVTGTLTGATNVTVERYIPNNGFRSWRLLSVPTFGNGQTIRQAWQEGTANPLPLQNNFADHGTQITGVFANQAAATAAGFDSTSVQASMLSWNGTGWSNVTNTNTAIANNKAYFLFIRGERSKGVTGAITNSSATTLRTNGTVYTGNQVFNIPTGSFSLVANTYPSAINFTGLTRSNVSNLFYIWDSKKQNGNSLGVYQTFSFTNSFNCLIGGGSYILGQPNTTIESGQAFFVTGGNTAGGGTITLLESAKISGTNGNLGFRPSAIPAKIDSRLLDANNEVLDANVVVFDKAYSNAVDADDAVKFGNPGVNFAIETDSKILAIEGTQPVAEKDIVQFRMWNLQKQDYKLELVAGNMNVQGLYAVLEDKYLNTKKEIDLKGITKINFTVDANTASSAPGRFRIVFSKNKPVIEPNAKQGYTIAPNPVEGKIINLVFSNQSAGKYSIRIVGIDGQPVAEKVINHMGGNGNQLINLPAGITTGNYQVEIIAPGNVKTVKQLLVKTP